MKSRTKHARIGLASLLLAPIALGLGHADLPTPPLPAELPQSADVILAEGEWLDGKANGTWIYRTADGSTLVRARYKKGLRTGTYRIYYPSGNVRAEVKFKRDVPTGPWVLFDEEGERMQAWSGEYESAHEFWPNNNTRVSGQNKDGVPHGLWLFSWPNGSPWLTAWFENGEPVERWKHFHLDGLEDEDFFAEPWQPSRDPDWLRDMPWALMTVDLTVAPGEKAKHLDLLQPPEAKATDATNRSLAELARELFTESAASFSSEQSLLGLEPERWSELSVFDLPALLTELCAIDPTTDRAGLVRELNGPLASIFQGVRLSPIGANHDEAKLALRRAISIWGLTRSEPSWWDLHLSFAAKLGIGEAACMRPLPHVTPKNELDLVPPSFRGRFDPVFSDDEDRHLVTRSLVDRGLTWLAETQHENGKWDDVYGHDSGLVGLALLAFLGDGNTATTGPWAEQVRKCAKFICSKISAKRGQIFPTNSSSIQIYDHMICNLALLELYAVSPSEGLAEAVLLATATTLKYRQENSGWGYVQESSAVQADTSLTAWAMQILLASSAVGLNPPEGLEAGHLDEALEGGFALYSKNRNLETGRVGYNAPGQTSARVTDRNDHFPAGKGEALTSIALFSHGLASTLLEGRFRAYPESQKKLGVALIMRRLPEWKPAELSCDMYFWYFGTHALYYQDTSEWERWQAALVDAALEGQEWDGSWPAAGPWGMYGGTAYSTAMMLLSLQTPVRYAGLSAKTSRK